MSDLHIICKIANVDYAIPADDVVQMESYGKITPVPGSPPYVSGLLQVRQKVVPVIDARLRFGLPQIEPTADSRFVILKYGPRIVGLLVDSAREVRKIPATEFHATPVLIENQNDGFIKSVAQLKDRIIMLIDGLKVIGAEADHGKN